MKKLIVIGGPTAAGKTKVALEIAKYLKTEIVSADSRQIYKELNIGTAVPSSKELIEVKHHFIQNISILEPYNASKYEFAVLDLLEKLFKIYDNVVLVGGSGMYIDALCKGIDDLPTIDAKTRLLLTERENNEGLINLVEELKEIDLLSYQTIDLKNPKRVLKALEVFYMTGKPYSSFLKHVNKNRSFETIKIAVNKERETLYNDINKRVLNMMNQGLENEAGKVHEFKNLTSINTIGYREMFDYFEQKTTLDEAIDLIQRNTRKYARKQISWFNRGAEYQWFDTHQLNQIIEFIKQKT